jgi:hypothetical protein
MVANGFSQGGGHAFAPRERRRLYRDLYEQMMADRGVPGHVLVAFPCDRTFARTEEALRRRGLDVEACLAWLRDHGARCDCTIVLNAADSDAEARRYYGCGMKARRAQEWLQDRIRDHLDRMVKEGQLERVGPDRYRRVGA